MSRIVCSRAALNYFLNRKAPPLLIQRATIVKSPIDHDESYEEYEERLICYFNRCDIDGWELRKGLNDYAGMDLIPDPKVIIAAFCAARRVNDYPITTRILEMVKFKCGPQATTVFPLIMTELQPSMRELGIDPLEKMGYDEPELALENVFEMDGPCKKD